MVAYFNGPAPADPVLEGLGRRSTGTTPVRGLHWQERLLPRLVRAERLDVFFAPAYSCPLRLDVPRVTTIHDLSFFSWPDDMGVLESLRRRALVSASVAASRRLIADSDFGRREIAARFPAAAFRIATIPLGPDDDLPPAPPRDVARRRIGALGPRILTVGSIFNRRRLPVLLDAVARLRRAGVPVELDVVGDNRTSPRLDVDGLVRELGLATAVQVLGFVPEDELAARYAAADAFVFLSEYEGFGLPVLEAMVRGVPVVTSTRPCLGELFAGAACLVEPTDAAAVAAALGHLLTSPRLREDFVARGHAHAARFSWAEAAGRTLDVLREAAA